MAVEGLDLAQQFLIVAQSDEDFVVGLDGLGQEGKGTHVEVLLLGFGFLRFHHATLIIINNVPPSHR